MELRHLRYFQVLGQELHFARAAEKLFITQPALTKQIQHLEEEIGTPLLRRTKRQVALTEAGQYFLEESNYVLNHLNNVVRSTQRKALGEEGEVRIGFVGSAMQNVIPELLLSMHEAYPKVQANLEELNNNEQLKALGQDRIDIGFVRMELVPDQFERRVVYEDSFSLVLPAGHVLNEQNFHSLTQLREERFILFSNDYSPDYFDNIMSIFVDHDFNPHVSYRSVHANTIFRLVEKELGVAIIPSSLASGVDLGVKFISLEQLRQRTRLLAVWSGRNNNPVLQRLLALL